MRAIASWNGRQRSSSPPYAAHHHQGVEGLRNDGIAGVMRALPALERGDQQTMGGRDIAVGLQQGRGRGDGRLEGSLDLCVAPPQLRKHVRGVAQVAGDVGADVGGRCESPLSVGAHAG